MSEHERESEVIDIDNDSTVPGASKQTNRTVTDRLMKKPSHEDFVVAYDSIITSSSTSGKDTVLTRRTTWTVKILSPTDDRL